MNVQTRDTLHFAYPRPRDPGVKVKPTKVAKRHDFGPHGQLTVAEASKLLGISEGTLWRRTAAGLPVEDLISTKHLNSRPRRDRNEDYSMRGTFGGFRGIGVGIFLHRHYGAKPPTWQQVVSLLDCSRSTAYRIVRSYKDALGLP